MSDFPRPSLLLVLPLSLAGEATRASPLLFPIETCEPTGPPKYSFFHVAPDDDLESSPVLCPLSVSRSERTRPFWF